MPARFFVDENMIPVGRALDAVRGEVRYPGHVELPEVPTGTVDLDWLPIVGRKGLDLVVITRDSNIRVKPAELAAFRDNGVRAFFLTGKKDLTRWEKLELIVRSWDRIEKAIKKAGEGPWAQAVVEGQIKPLDI